MIACKRLVINRYILNTQTLNAMVNREIAEKNIHYGQGLAVDDLANLETGFLTNEYMNIIEKEAAKGIALQSEYIIRELIKQLTNSNATPDDYECRVLFQYIFDKVAEVTYKTIVEDEINTELNIKEAFEYHEPDLPYYIQQKITNAVPKIVSLANKVLWYIDENDYRTTDLDYWLLPFLLLPSGLAMQFVMEMDLNDDSELRHSIGED